jgi:hypothetical protein
MRTTLTLDEDVIDKTKKLAAKLHKPFRVVINDVLRLGLEQAEKPMKRRRYKTQGHAMGLRDGYNLDNIQELITCVEGENSR